MDSLENALEMLSVKVESIADSSKKLTDEVKDTDININKGIREVEKCQKIFYGLTPADRDQAVYERVIPKAYRDVQFDVQRIKTNIKNQFQKSGGLYRVHKFDDYASTCQGILSLIRMHKLPEQSYLIGAPNGFGKTSFVNESLITLRKHGYKVAPYISLWELAQIRVDNEHRIMNPYKKFKKENENVVYTEHSKVEEYCKTPTVITGNYSYSEYINADCLFVYFTDVISKDIESHTLYQLLSVRSSKGLPTIVTISTSLEPYENDRNLKEFVWDEIKAYEVNSNCFDRVLHVSCYKKKSFNIDSREEKIDRDTGIVS
jgi:hypothetical protein